MPAIRASGRVHNRYVTVRPDRRLALLALAKFAGLGSLLGAVVGVGMALDGESTWSLLAAPAVLAAVASATVGAVVALIWWLIPGRVIYTVADGFLTARRGAQARKRIPIDRVADLRFDQQIAWADLVFTGWFGFVSPIPKLLVTMTPTSNRWDPSNASVEQLPRILLSGPRQQEALLQLREAVQLSPGGPSD